MPLSSHGLHPFPFIVGCSRSGKSLLKAMLDAHPEMAVAVETHFVAGVARNRRRYEGSDRFRTEIFLRDLVAGSALSELGLDQDEVRAAAASGRMADCPSAVRELFAIHARRWGKTRFGNRTAIHVLSMPWISSARGSIHPPGQGRPGHGPGPDRRQVRTEHRARGSPAVAAADPPGSERR